MNLPKVMMITGGAPIEPDEFVKKIIAHVARGIRLIQLRVKNVTEANYIVLARAVLQATKNHDVKVILNCKQACFEEVKAQGLHLTSDHLMSIDKRPLSSHYIVSASCHDSAQLLKAEELGVDFVTLSPVMQTQSHPDANPLGWALFSKLCKVTRVPIYALGGLAPEHLEKATSLGAYGLAAIGSLWDRH